MDELKQEIQQLKQRIGFLEMFHKPCYEIVLNYVTLNIDDVLNSRDELYVQIVHFVLNRGIVQALDSSKIYICHKHIWIRSDVSLKQMFMFVENLYIQAYKDYVDQHPELNGIQYEKYNSIIYSLNLKKYFNKMKNLIIESYI